jgi:uncharacterized low-complexity protein
MTNKVGFQKRRSVMKKLIVLISITALTAAVFAGDHAKEACKEKGSCAIEKKAEGCCGSAACAEKKAKKCAGKAACESKCSAEKAACKAKSAEKKSCCGTCQTK